MRRFRVICLFGLSALSSSAYATSWAALPMKVPRFLVDAFAVTIFNGPTVSTYFGTPPQEVDLTVDLATDWLAAYAYDMRTTVYCAVVGLHSMLCCPLHFSR